MCNPFAGICKSGTSRYGEVSARIGAGDSKLPSPSYEGGGTSPHGSHPCNGKRRAQGPALANLHAYLQQSLAKKRSHQTFSGYGRHTSTLHRRGIRTWTKGQPPRSSCPCYSNLGTSIPKACIATICTATRRYWGN